MSTVKNVFTTPVGRLVAGSPYRAKTTNSEGAPLVWKSGANAGQPRVEYYEAIAIPKGSEPHWNQTPWGALIWQVGTAAMPSAGQNPKFAWKITDGDSQIPNGKGNRPCDREGWPGHWVLHFSSSYAPAIYNRDGSAKITEENAVKTGYYIQINGDVAFNNSASQPGVFLNASMLALSAKGAEIFMDQDASGAGFGGGALPVGAIPIESVGGFGAPPVNPVPVTQAPPQPVMPNAQFTAVPPAPGAVVPPPVPVAPPARQMTAKAAGATYEQMIAAGWTDALLVEHGHMVG